MTLKCYFWPERYAQSFVLGFNIYFYIIFYYLFIFIICYIFSYLFPIFILFIKKNFSKKSMYGINREMEISVITNGLMMSLPFIIFRSINLLIHKEVLVLCLNEVLTLITQKFAEHSKFILLLLNQFLSVSLER